MKILSVLFAILIHIAACCQFNPSEYQILVTKTNEDITINGVLDEPVWLTMDGITNFWQHYPKDTVHAIRQTIVKITYDDENMYIGALCLEEDPHPVIQNLIRDDNGNFWNSDGFSVIIEPLNTNKAGYYFALNAAGAKQDGFISQQGFQPNLDMFWDNYWLGQVSHSNEGYYYELAIPFYSMKFNPETTTWGINFVRNDMKRNAFDLWTRFPSSYNGLDLAFNGQLTFADGLPSISSRRFEFKPSLSGKMNRTIEQGEVTEYTADAGIDAKYAVNENINLDIALFPDFSTVEVDQQYIDFYRFEYKDAERRAFFLENNDLFASPGSDEDYSIVPGDAYRIKPFYTRRIGIKNWEHTPIVYGTRLTGSMNNDFRIGLLNVQTKKYEEDAPQNYSALALQKSVAKNFSLSGLFLNRQAFGQSDMEFGEQLLPNYNRNAGLEFDFVGNDSRFSATMLYYKSFLPDIQNHTNFYGTEIDFRTSKFRTRNMFYHVDENYVSDMGYIPRLYHYDAITDTTYREAYSEISNLTKLTFFPGTRLQFLQLWSRSSIYLHTGGNLNEYKQQIHQVMEFKDRSLFITGIQYGYFNMLYPNDIVKNDNPLPAGKYEDLSFHVNWITNPRRSLVLNVLAEYGKFYNGRKLFTDAKLIFKIQPWGMFTLSHNLCELKFPEFTDNETYHLVGVRSEINFTRDISWTTLMQYNTQIDNININSLFRWRFRPLSDLYFVIKDDMTNGWDQKKIQVIFKVNYWFKV
ncbi:MAG: carbohydrate binding family 9 domain-containing protein [Bacteroidales bacterium]|nr:carbohydrate binding family 9 domain-containing protein [Bacteroidales bacterium]